MNTIGKRITAAVVIIAAVIAQILYLSWQDGAFLPRWIEWREKSLEATVGGTTYNVILNENKAVEVCVCDTEAKTIWETKSDIKVQDVLSCDIDGDGDDELVILCWKIGHFGISMPFWEHDKKEWAQHLYVYEYDSGAVSPKWMSSYLGLDVKEMSSQPVTDTKSRLVFADTDGVLNYYIWSSWGFEKQESAVTVSVFGDNLIHEPIYNYGLNNDKSFSFLYKNVRDIIAQSDISIINQETPLVDNPNLYGGYPLFGTPINVGQAIVNAGFDIVTCATNHALDRGMYGIDTTKNFFTQNNVTCIGIQSADETEYKPYELMTRNGITFALLNYTYGTNGIKIPEENKYAVHLLSDEDQIKSDLKAARENADIVIVFPHWGTENSTEADKYQQKWTQLFLESGVDIVVGTHTHTLQPYELLVGDDNHTMLVYYSIGNYVSAQASESAVKGGIARFTISATDQGFMITDYTLTPLTIKSYGGGKFVPELQE
jgi:poly-gamma-glutamate capsule biosynthesis protein CapA/YwtB (metallophosphatase superfamily)